jgi:hypothetical protein
MNYVYQVKNQTKKKMNTMQNTTRLDPDTDPGLDTDPGPDTGPGPDFDFVSSLR